MDDVTPQDPFLAHEHNIAVGKTVPVDLSKVQYDEPPTLDDIEPVSVGRHAA